MYVNDLKPFKWSLNHHFYYILNENYYKLEKIKDTLRNNEIIGKDTNKKAKNDVKRRNLTLDNVFWFC